MNLIRPILRSRGHRLMSSELSWRAIPHSNAHEDRDRAAVAANLIDSRWHQTQMDSKVRLALYLADNCGVAYLKQFWNPAIGSLTSGTKILPHPQTRELTEYPVDKNGQPLHDEQGNPAPRDTPEAFTFRPGDTDTAVRTIFNVRTNPDAWGILPDEGCRWLIDLDVVPISVIREIWKERAAKVQATPGVAMMRQYEAIVRAVAARAGNANTTNDLTSGRGGQILPDKETTLLAQYWEHPTDTMPDGRLIVMAGEELLYPLDPSEEGLPQKTMTHVAVYSERRPLDSAGRPIVEDLVAPQRVINRQWGAILEEQAHAGIGQWAMFDIPGLSDQITNLSGAHIKVPMTSGAFQRSISELVQRIQPAQASPDRWRLIEAARAMMFDIGSYHEIQRGQVPPGVDSGVAVEMLRETENGQLQDSVRDLKASLILWGRQTGALAKWGYGADEARWIPQRRPDLGYLVTDVYGRDLPDFETIDLTLEGFRPHSQAAFNAQIRELMAEGVIDPRRGLQLMDIGRGIEAAFDSQNRHYARARRQNLALEQHEYQVIPPPPESPQAMLGVIGCFLYPDGGPFVLPQDDDHLVCIDVHQELALDDTKPLEVRQAALMLIAERRAFLQQLLLAQGAAAMPSSGEDGDPSAKSKSKPPPSAGKAGTSDA